MLQQQTIQPHIEPARRVERHFDTVQHLCMFVAAAINKSRQKHAAIARACGVCPGTVSRLASGHTQEPRASTLLKILRHLGFTVLVAG